MVDEKLTTLCRLSFATYLSAGAGYLNNWDFTGKLPKSD